MGVEDFLFSLNFGVRHFGEKSQNMHFRSLASRLAFVAQTLATMHGFRRNEKRIFAATENETDVFLAPERLCSCTCNWPCRPSIQEAEGRISMMFVLSLG